MQRSIGLACLVASSACGRIAFDAPAADAADPMLVACRMTHPTAVFCDGFEQATGDAWDYTINENGSTASTTTRPYRGERSFEATTLQIDDYKYARWGRFIASGPVTTGDLFIRQFVYFPSTAIVDNQLSILTTGNGDPPYPSTYVLLLPGQIVLATYGSETRFDALLPRDRWVCMELHIKVDEVAGFAELALDGGAPLRGVVADTAVEGGYTNIDIGVHYATPLQSTVTFWVDELVLARAPIGCT